MKFIGAILLHSTQSVIKVTLERLSHQLLSKINKIRNVDSVRDSRRYA